MRVTIIYPDRAVTKDGLTYSNLAFTLPNNIHAVQWFETEGEVEICDAQGRMVENKAITDLSPFQSALDAWQLRHDTPAPAPTPV
jgi:hypothetical protein